MAKKQDFQFDNVEISGGDNAARMMPLAVNDRLRFELSENMFVRREAVLGGVRREWTDVVAANGVAISATQLTRHNNGLPLQGITIRDRLRSFVELFSDGDPAVLHIQLVDIIERDFGQTRARYLRFAVV